MGRDDGVVSRGARPARWRRGRVLALAMASVLATATAGASLAASFEFTPRERALIARNESLRAAAAKDPALARRAMRAMNASQAGSRSYVSGTRELRSDNGRGPSQVGRPPRKRNGFDPRRDPDMNQYQRSSPEAAHDLFQLLKRASDGSTRKPAE